MSAAGDWIQKPRAHPRGSVTDCSHSGATEKPAAKKQKGKGKSKENEKGEVRFKKATEETEAMEEDDDWEQSRGKQQRS